MTMGGLSPLPAILLAIARRTCEAGPARDAIDDLFHDRFARRIWTIPGKINIGQRRFYPRSKHDSSYPAASMAPIATSTRTLRKSNHWQLTLIGIHFS